LFLDSFFLKNINLIKALINIGFIGQFIWILDFIFKILTGKYLFGVTSYIFENNFTWLIFIPIIAHFFSTLLALILTLKEKPNFISIGFSLIYLVIIYILTLIYTNPLSNINCIYEICGFETIILPFYTQIWPFFALLFIILPTYLLQVFIYKKQLK